ncbi:MAG: DUF4065 domain-containing protein [Trichodesmium sp. MO_231.B1]|nr:DUF4065 domain-containing protein [Trichodesmium sp. MO_231.B1]
MINPLEIAKYFIMRAYEDGREAQITNMKIQKLLYYSQCLYLALNDEPLFADEIQAWRYGPVCPPAYKFYSKFEAEQLPIPNQESIANISSEIKEVLEETWQYFGEYHAYYLSDLTHLEFPWKKARKGLPSYASSTEPILLEDMRLLGEEKLLEIEKGHPHYAPIVSHILETAIESKEEPEYIQQGEVNDWLNSLLN